MAMRSRVHTSVANPWAWAPSSSACSIPSKALAGYVELAGDLGLGAALGEQLGGPFPAGLTLGPLAGPSLSCLLLAAVGRHGQACSYTNRPTVTSKRKDQ